MPRKQVWPPTIHHRGGNDYIKIPVNGKRREIGLGTSGSAEAAAEYARLLALAKAGGSPLLPEEVLTCEEAAALHLEERKPQEDGGTYTRRRTALQAVLDLYGTRPLAEFGPVAAAAVRTRLAARGCCKNYLAALMGCVRAWVKWCVSKEMCAATQLVAVQALSPSREGAENPEPRQPARVEDVTAALPLLPWPVGDMVRLQLLTGMRPGEVCKLSVSMIDRKWREVDGVPLWLASFGKHHKTAWKGGKREVVIGPQAQGVLLPYLLRGEDEPLFDALEMYLREKGTRRKRGQVRTRKMHRCFDTGRYDDVVRECLRKHGLPLWTPHQLRHRVATDLFTAGDEADAQAVLGHDDISTTRIYTSRLERAAKVMARMG